MTRFNLAKTVQGPVVLPPEDATELRIWIDDELLEWFRKRSKENSGGDYRQLINHALREYVENHPDGLDDAMRAVLRQPKKPNTKLLEKLRRLSASKPKRKRARRAI